jgi:flagellar assembly protein FliH
MSSDRIAPGKVLSMSAQPFVYRTVRGVAEAGGGSRPARNGAQSMYNSAGEQEAWQQGCEEGKKQAVRDFQEAIARERKAVMAAVTEFSGERDAYFRDVEPEVVRLALAITKRILHREAQLDPLILAGVVRVALEKVSGSTAVKLHVHPSQMSAWENFIGRQQDLPSLPVLVPDPTLQRDQCVLHTSLGITEINLETQLKEVEQGFFDLLERRPKIGQ